MESLSDCWSVFTDCENGLAQALPLSTGLVCLKTVHGSLRDEKAAKGSRNALFCDYAISQELVLKLSLAKEVGLLSHLPPPPKAPMVFKSSMLLFFAI